MNFFINLLKWLHRKLMVRRMLWQNDNAMVDLIEIIDNLRASFAGLYLFELSGQLDIEEVGVVTEGSIVTTREQVTIHLTLQTDKLLQGLHGRQVLLTDFDGKKILARSTLQVRIRDEKNR